MATNHKQIGELRGLPLRARRGVDKEGDVWVEVWFDWRGREIKAGISWGVEQVLVHPPDNPKALVPAHTFDAALEEAIRQLEARLETLSQREAKRQTYVQAVDRLFAEPEAQ